MNRAEFDGYVRQFSNMVRGAILKVIPSVGYDTELDDIEQETWLKAWEKRNSFDPDKAQIQTWLTMLAHGTAVDYVRREGAQKRPPLVLESTLPEVPYYEAELCPDEYGSCALPPYTEGPEQVLEAKEEASRIAALVKSLPPRVRDVWTMSTKGATDVEVAIAHGISAANVRLIMHRVKKLVTNG